MPTVKDYSAHVGALIDYLAFDAPEYVIRTRYAQFWAEFSGL